MTTQTPSGTIYPEIGFSCEPISDDAITYFCYNYLDYTGWADDYERNEMIKALKEVCKTPTGRQAFRATQYFINEKRKTDPDYKIEVEFAGYSWEFQACVLPSNPNKITFFQDSLEKNIQSLHAQYLNNTKNDPSSKATEPLSDEARDKLFYTSLGIDFSHEAGHVRQLQNPDQFKGDISELYADASTQALSQQIALESGLPSLCYMRGVPTKEIEEYHKAVDYDPKTGSFDTKKASVYSAKMLQKRTKDFITNFEDKPYTNNGSLTIRWVYLKTDILSRTLTPDQPTFQEGQSSNKLLLDTLQKTHRLRMDKTINKDLSVGTFFDEKGKVLQKKLSLEERKALYDRCYMLPMRIEPSLDLFESDKNTTAEEKLKLALEYYNGIKDVEDKLIDLKELAHKIYNNPSDEKALKESAEIRKVLREKYGIKISTHNKDGKRIAQNEAEQTSTLPHTLAMSGDDITQGSAKTDSTQRSITPQQNTRLT